MANKEIRTNQTVWLVIDGESGVAFDAYDTEQSALIAIQETRDPEQRLRYDVRAFRVKAYVADPPPTAEGDDLNLSDLEKALVAWDEAGGHKPRSSYQHQAQWIVSYLSGKREN